MSRSCLRFNVCWMTRAATTTTMKRTIPPGAHRNRLCRARIKTFEEDSTVSRLPLIPYPPTGTVNFILTRMFQFSEQVYSVQKTETSLLGFIVLCMAKSLQAQRYQRLPAL